MATRVGLLVTLTLAVGIAITGSGCGRAKPPASHSGSDGAFDAEPYDVSVDWDSTPNAPLDAKADRPAAISLTATDGSGLRLASLEARAVLYGPLAFTELSLEFDNDEPRVREGTFSITLPENASVSRFAMRLGAGWQEAEVVEQKRARSTYEAFLHRNVDPALFEQDRGNVFRGRVFPIAAGERKAIVISYTEEIVEPSLPYRVGLRGLPAMDLLDVQLLVPSAKKAFVLHRKSWAPERDFVYTPPPGLPLPSAVRGGQFAVARAPASAPTAGAEAEAEARIDSLAVLVDSSASQGPAAYVERLDKVARAIDALGAKTLHVACFDQEIVPEASVAAAAKRKAAGASDLRAGLRWIRSTGAKRAVVVTDGVASMGPTETRDLVAEVLMSKPAGLERLDMLAAGAHGERDDHVLYALTQAGLPKEGVVVDAETASPDAIAGALRRGAARPARLAYLELEDAGAPLPVPLRDVRAVEAPEALVARAVARAKIAELYRARDALGTGESAREDLERRIVDLSIRHRVLSPFTSMLVLETDRDYERFGIDRRALRDILVVGPRGVELTKRAGPTLPGASSGVSPLIDTGQQRAGDVDADHDGIPDESDKCPTEPETYNGFQDDDGCPDRANVVVSHSSITILEQIHFRDGSTVIEPASTRILDALAEVMQQRPEIELVEIGGHTDNRGNPEANLRLSEARARAVRDALVKRGVEPSRLVAKGYGDTRPIDDNKTETGRDKNRRVELRILRTDERPRPWRPSFRPTQRPSKAAAAPPRPPLEGPMQEVDDLLGRHDTAAALRVAGEWRARAPRDLLAWVAEGRALEAAGDYGAAARAYGSMIDLATKPEHRRAAAGYLEALGSRHRPALDLAIDAYGRAARERPEIPSGHRLLAFALARANRLQEALDVTTAALARSYDGRYPVASELLRADSGLFTAALARSPTATAPSTEIVLTWESDESDLDLRLVGDSPALAFAAFDASRGYGPEAIFLSPPTTPTPLEGTKRIEVHQVTRGPSGWAFGKVSIVRHDGRGGLTFDDRPFVVMRDGGVVSLGPLGR
jgi:outer membrane protein OmpA-like peptidoglycan-associated protein